MDRWLDHLHGWQVGVRVRRGRRRRGGGTAASATAAAAGWVEPASAGCAATSTAGTPAFCGARRHFSDNPPTEKASAASAANSKTAFRMGRR